MLIYGTEIISHLDIDVKMFYSLCFIFYAVFCEITNAKILIPKDAQPELELITAIPNLVNLQPDKDNGAQRIENEFSETLQTHPDTLEQLLDFLKEVKSPISSVLDLRNILVVQKEEKMAMETIIRELKAEMVGLR